MSTGPKIQRQPWIDYLVCIIEKEDDANVRKYSMAVKAIVEDSKTNQSKIDNNILILESLKTHILLEAKNPYRINNLMDGIITFTKKLENV
ncbi:hypothetical protein UFOVP49_171 [uncultured Caudovirales phage]|uniref:Uncharacterized protein n=1 Tax=uncultured Caudovirales phage TaxID=2100421 RepID=A0A6J5KTK8_9CAUD|nr:hypothetical protein UFOVP49_171 [uncultured Caudovirales phage]